MSDQVKVKIKPNRGIGGYGGPDDVVMMERELAAQYEKDGYVEILGNAEGGMQSAESTLTSPPPPLLKEMGEDHVIMKPEVKRMRRTRKK